MLFKHLLCSRLYTWNIKRNMTFSALWWVGGGRETYNRSFQCDSSVFPLQWGSQMQMPLGTRPTLWMSEQTSRDWPEHTDRVCSIFPGDSGSVSAVARQECRLKIAWTIPVRGRLRPAFLWETSPFFSIGNCAGNPQYICKPDLAWSHQSPPLSG